MSSGPAEKGAVLVTGGARRIGRAISDALAARGWRVLVHSRDPGNPLCADFREDGAAERLFAAAAAAAPDLCALVNNASVFPPPGKTLSPEDVEETMRVNAAVPEALAELLAARMEREGRRGAAVNVLDSRVLRAGPDVTGASPYAYSKKILADATVADAVRFAPHLRVNGVAPGPALRPADASVREKGGPVLLHRRPSPEDIAATVAFLLEAETLTGQIVAVDSGQSLLRGRSV